MDVAGHLPPKKEMAGRSPRDIGSSDALESRLNQPEPKCTIWCCKKERHEHRGLSPFANAVRRKQSVPDTLPAQFASSDIRSTASVRGGTGLVILSCEIHIRWTIE
jgi:hypothetical protein